VRRRRKRNGSRAMWTWMVLTVYIHRQPSNTMVKGTSWEAGLWSPPPATLLSHLHSARTKRPTFHTGINNCYCIPSGPENRDERPWGSVALTTWHPSIRKKLALTSPTGGGHSVCIVRSRTKATEEYCIPLHVWQDKKDILLKNFKLYWIFVREGNLKKSGKIKFSSVKIY